MRVSRLVGLLLLAGCAVRYPMTSPAPIPAVAADAAAQRLERLRQIASLDGIAPPLIEAVSAPASADPAIAAPVQVVRLVFPEPMLFDTASDVPRPEFAPVLNLIAQDMAAEGAGAQVTVVGHTDAIGGDAYNLDLSQRRAGNVLRALLRRGVDPAGLSAVAIGKRQPIASNATPEGRARNRRVEFLISSSLAANLAIVAQQPVDPADAALAPSDAAAAVLRPHMVDGGGFVLEPSRLLGLNYQPGTPATQPAAAALADSPAPVVAKPPPIAHKLAPAPHYAPNKLEDFHKQDLGPPQTF